MNTSPQRYLNIIIRFIGLKYVTILQCSVLLMNIFMLTAYPWFGKEQTRRFCSFSDSFCFCYTMVSLVMDSFSWFIAMLNSNGFRGFPCDEPNAANTSFLILPISALFSWRLSHYYLVHFANCRAYTIISFMLFHETYLESLNCYKSINITKCYYFNNFILT